MLVGVLAQHTRSRPVRDLATLVIVPEIVPELLSQVLQVLKDDDLLAEVKASTGFASCRKL